MMLATREYLPIVHVETGVGRGALDVVETAATAAAILASNVGSGWDGCYLNKRISLVIVLVAKLL